MIRECPVLVGMPLCSFYAMPKSSLKRLVFFIIDDLSREDSGPSPPEERSHLSGPLQARPKRAGLEPWRGAVEDSAVRARVVHQAEVSLAAVSANSGVEISLEVCEGFQVVWRDVKDSNANWECYYV